jgi:Integrase core domain
MDRFRAHYNHDRPHQALGGHTPAQRYQPGTALVLPTVDLEPADHTPPEALSRKTGPSGRFTYANRSFELGERFAGITIGVLRDHGRLHVYYGSSLIETFLVGTQLPTPKR